VAFAVISAGAWFLFLREGALIALGQADHPVPDFSFQLRRVNAASVATGSEAGLEEPAEGVRETLDALYVAGFVDPDKWENGSFPEALEQFEGRAARQAKVDVAFLTLGGEASHVAFVEPVVGKLDIRFLLDADEQPSGAVATTRFVAEGEFEGGDPMFILHDGTYYLRPTGEGWGIVGYDVNGVVQPGRRPTGGPTAAPTAGASP
jgi:hypothetical protein